MKLRFCEHGAFDVVAVGFVDNNSVSHFHDSAFDALEFVAGSGELDKQEEVDHRVYGSFALSDAHCFDEYVVVSGGFAKHDGFARFSRHSSKRACRGARSNECVRVKRKFLHASFVAEDATLCNFATGVYGEHGEAPAVFEDV